MIAEDSLYGNESRMTFVTQMLEMFRGERPASNITVLDFGCGTGEMLSSPVSDLGYNVHGVDSHRESIERANAIAATSRTPDGPAKAKFSCRTLEELARDGLRFDVILASEVLEHLYQPGETIELFHKILKPRGLCIVTVPNGFGPFENLRRLQHFLRLVGIDALFSGLSRRIVSLARKVRGKSAQATETPGSGYLNFDSGHVQFYRKKSFEKMFADLGFLLLRVEGRSFVCGPYADFWAQFVPWKRRLFKLNSRLAKLLPLCMVSDWMYAFRRDPE